MPASTLRRAGSQPSETLQPGTSVVLSSASSSVLYQLSPSLHSPFLKGDRRRHAPPQCSITPALPFLKLVKISRRLPFTGSEQIAQKPLSPAFAHFSGITNRPGRHSRASRRRIRLLDSTFSPSGFYIRNSVFTLASSPPRPTPSTIVSHPAPKSSVER